MLKTKLITLAATGLALGSVLFCFAEFQNSGISLGIIVVIFDQGDGFFVCSFLESCEAMLELAFRKNIGIAIHNGDVPAGVAQNLIGL